MFTLDRCQVIPEEGHRASFRVAGRELVRWNYGMEYPRPFFYPVLGPSGVPLTRMGHPGASNHDHHRSVWFAHNKLLGIDFWSDLHEPQIRQRQWFAYEDGADFARMSVLLGWYDGHDPQPLVNQEVVTTFRPREHGEYTLEFQCRFTPQADSIEFQQTNFGFLAVRMAKSISSHFGGGELTGADGQKGEPNLFGNPNAWMDYSGPVMVPEGGGRMREVVEGITYFDHPQNPAYPAKWHVREDGWMGTSACRDAALETTTENPLLLRYMLYIHRSGPQVEMNAKLAEEWAARPALVVQKSAKKHTDYEVVDAP
ncbi:MAG: PmoA family protein [Planctomycetaceae bacterium]